MTVCTAGERKQMPATILVVDDHEGVRHSLRDWLEVEFPRCRVICACSAEDALALSCKLLPEVVVMDLTLPGMGGIEATRRLRALLPSVQVVVLTIFDSETQRSDAGAAGAGAYVTKQAMRTQLIPTVTAMLAKSSPV